MASDPLAMPPRTVDRPDESVVRQIPKKLPDLLPARMLNEYVYCPRLFFYEWVEGVFESSADTLDGNAKHSRVDTGPGAMPSASAAEGAYATLIWLARCRPMN